MKMKSIIIFIVSNLKPWSWFNFISIAERTCRDAKNLLWKIRSMTCRNVKNNWNWYFNLKLVFNSIDQIQFVILLKGNVDNAFFTSYVLSSSNVSQSFAHPDFAGVEKTQQKKQTVYSNVSPCRIYNLDQLWWGKNCYKYAIFEASCFFMFSWGKNI